MLKDEAKQVIDQLPDDCSLEDIHYALYVKSKIQKGIDAAEKGDVLTQEEVEKHFVKWFNQ
jgi:predicted transcriptional regulator